MTCPFCSIDVNRVAFSNESVIAIWDRFPESHGHLLIVPRRHVSGWSNLEPIEKGAILEAIEQAYAIISERFQPDGFNVGFNDKSVAGETAFHFQLHVIPQYVGDVTGDRGGIQQAIPDRRIGEERK